MSFAWLKRFRRAHHGLAYLLTGLLVLMAVVGFSAIQLLPLLERHPDRIASWLSERAGRDVHFDGVETSWTRRGPLLQLDNLRLGKGDTAIRFGDAEVLVSQYAGLLPGRSFTELRVRGLDLTLERDAAGRWQVRGMPGQQGGRDPFEVLERLGELQLVGARLRVLAPMLGIDARIPQAHLRLQVSDDSVRAGLRAWMRTEGAPVEGAVQFDRDSGDGRAWLSATDIDLSEWSTLLHGAGLYAKAGSGRLQAWAELDARRVTQVLGDVDLRSVSLSAEQAAPGSVAATTEFALLRGKARWAMDGKQWRIDVPRFVFGEGGEAPRIEALAAQNGAGRSLAAKRIDISPLVAVAALSNRVQPGLRRWLHAARPQGALLNVQVSSRGSDVVHAAASLSGAGFEPVGQAPGIQHLSGRLQGDASAVRFVPDAAGKLSFDWPSEYRQPHVVGLRGEIVGWREGQGWRVGTPAMRVSGDGYAVDARGGLWFQGDGTRPWIDLVADVAPAQVPVASKFWMQGKMPAAAVRWLESALQGGRVEDAHAVVSGDLDDWPFRENNGLFHASARIADGIVKFQPDWPEARGLDGQVDFVADGFRVEGQRASIAGVAIGAFDAGIEHFGDAVLTVNAKGQGDASRLLALLRQSPLQKTHGSTLSQLQASGPAVVGFSLTQPLHRGGPKGVVDGEVSLDNARLVAREWGLDFEKVRGKARYAAGGFKADALDVVQEKHPGKLSLRAGDEFVANAGNAFEGELAAVLTARSLLARAPELSWLRGRITGASPWTIAVSLPKGSAGTSAPNRLQLRSDLVGTRMELPAPLAKPASVRLPTTINVALPLDKGDVAVAFGQRMALRARSANGRTGVRVALGTSQVPPQVPVDGIVATGRSRQLDAVGWATVATGPVTTGASGGGTAGKPLALRNVDINVADLRLVGASFPNTRLQAVPAQGSTAVRVEGPALKGAVMLPQGGGGAIAGSFERLYWRAAKPDPAAGGAAAPAVVSAGSATATDTTDPSKVPALNLTVDDFRFGDARLGTAGLRTQPTATGMRIEHLETRAPKQAIDINGEWRGGAGAQTQLEMNVRSQDFGSLMSGLGLGSQVKEGNGNIGVDARWRGSPADFALANLEGKVDVGLRDGQLVQIEPGAGRVLGLLSIAQLPRRLSFDFSDFFEKGFAFDTIEGGVYLQGGSARSDALTIDGPAAEIRINGVANLRGQTYDQTIDVYPKAGTLLTVAGAIAGGPVGAAIGAAANAVLNKPIGQMAARRYRVTGPWKDPKVETVRHTGNSSAATAQPADNRN